MNKCACPKPEKLPLTAYGDFPSWRNVFFTLGNILHYKKADRYCERCGRGLCGDCVESVGYHQGKFGFSSYRFPKDICPQCAEDLK